MGTSNIRSNFGKEIISFVNKLMNATKKYLSLVVYHLINNNSKLNTIIKIYINIFYTFSRVNGVNYYLLRLDS